MRDEILAMLPLVPQSHLDAPPDASKPLRLMEIVRRAVRERRYSRKTEQAYVHWIRRFVIFHGRRHPKDLGAEHVRDFLSALATQRRSKTEFFEREIRGHVIARRRGLHKTQRLHEPHRHEPEIKFGWIVARSE